MAYQPADPLLNYQQITTSEQASGRLFDGATTYVKLLKQAGALGTGTVTIAHGITGVTRFLRFEAGVQDTLPTWIPAPLSIVSTGGAVFGLSIRADATNIYIDIGTSWAAANALSDAWVIVEYLK